jgi:predicted HNH restriction endonuclease
MNKYKEDKKEYDRDYNLRNKEKRQGQRTEYKRIIKENLTLIFKNKCSLCEGVFNSGVFDFHHTNPKEKETQVSKATSYKQILEEVKKCIMLCANCHRTIHSKLDYNLTGY